MSKIDFTFCELRDREIVNVTDGKRLGRIADIAIDAKGRVLGFVVPGEKKFFKNLSSGDNVYIPWECILKIGSDVILVDLNNNFRRQNNPPVGLPE